MTLLTLTPQQARQIEREGAAAYPNECCGVMIGREIVENEKTLRHVDRLRGLENSFDAAEQFHRFALSPLDLMKAEKAAAAEKKLVLGFYHSHPDHPARPSEYDRQHAWPFYSYLIVSIAQGTAVDMTSWRLDENTATFSREDIVEQEMSNQNP
jgi:proteasome lid subunit RPN8/RPN11